MDFIDTLSLILPALALISVLLILFINLYTKFRSNGHVKVNCWFCNQWAKIPREQENSWNCPFCEQYNGFTKDGDYNKLIPEQHDELMNKVIRSTAHKDCGMPDNGLCSTCNNNQQLKVQQLAMFSPIDENHYEEEVQRYEKQLERAYRLCPQCEKVVKRTLHKQKSILLGQRLSVLRKQGLNLLDLNQSSSGISKTAKRRMFVTAMRYTTIILALVRMIEIYKRGDLNFSLPKNVVPYALLLRDISYLFFNSIEELYRTLQGIFFQNFNILIYINSFPYSPSVVLPFTGLFLQGVILLFSISLLEFTKSIAWITLLLCNVELFVFSNLVELLICCYILICPSSIVKQTKKMTFKKKPKIDNESSDEECDVKLLNSTFKTQYSDKSDSKSNLFDVSNNGPLKLFNLSKSDMPVFGKQAIFENPFNNTSAFNFSTFYRSGGSSNESISTKKSCFNDSLISSNYELKDPSPNKSSEQDWYKGLNDLHLSTYPKKLNGNEIPAAFRVASPLLCRPKPVLSPPRLRNVTQNSWVAGGYWKSNDFLNNVGTFTNLSRSSSQSSGFGSQASSQQPHFENHIFNSLPSSRTNSVCGEYDRFSVLSEPVYYNNSSPNICHQRFYPNLRPDQQIYICPKPQKPRNEWNQFAYPRPSSRESCFTQNVLNSSVSSCNLFSNNFGNSSFNNSTFQRSFSPNSNFSTNFSTPYEKGSLLKKWRQSTGDVD